MYYVVRYDAETEWIIRQVVIEVSCLKVGSVFADVFLSHIIWVQEK